MDPTALMGEYGVDAAKVLAVNELTNWIIGWLREWNLESWAEKLSWVIPAGCGIGLACLLGGSLDMENISTGIDYGLWATFTFGAYKVSKGE